MAKVLLVEDDNNLREIYEARLAAEGYEISSAQDGEEALVVAKQSKPDLVISDVMMPKISGFEMLDILRNTPGLEHVRVIMLTALGQSEDRDRADSLGADKYLVKSQVTLEDIVKTAHELLDDSPAPAAPAAAEATEVTPTIPVAEVPVTAAPPVADAVAEPVIPAPEETLAVESDLATPAPLATPTEPTTDDTSVSDDTTDVEAPVTEPTASVTTEPAVVAPEASAAESVETPTEPAQEYGSAAQEENLVSAQIDSFVNSMPAEAPAEPELITPAPEAETPAVEAEPVADSAPTATESVTEAPAVTPEPEAEPTAAPKQTAEQQAVTAADDQIMANAVDELAQGSLNEEPAVAAEPALEPANDSESQPDSAQETPEAVEATPTEAKAEAERTNISISGKKTIQPLASEPKPDINELLAREEAATNGAPVATGPAVISTPASEDLTLPPKEETEPPAIIHQPGQAFAPQPESEAAQETAVVDDLPSGAPAPTPSQKEGFDPNSVAL